MCVSSVCTQPPYNDNNLFNVFLFLKSSSVTSHGRRPRPREFDWQELLWRLTSDRPSVFHQTRTTPKRLRCLVVGCNNEHSSHSNEHTNITSAAEEDYVCFCALDLHKCVFVRANHSWSGFIYRRSEYKVFKWILANPFPNNVLISKFHDERCWSKLPQRARARGREGAEPAELINI